VAQNRRRRDAESARVGQRPTSLWPAQRGPELSRAPVKRARQRWWLCPWASCAGTWGAMHLTSWQAPSQCNGVTQPDGLWVGGTHAGPLAGQYGTD
jgi:hypothetical protein